MPFVTSQSEVLDVLAQSGPAQLVSAERFDGW